MHASCLRLQMEPSTGLWVQGDTGRSRGTLPRPRATGGPGSLQPRCSSGTEIARPREGSQRAGGCLPDVLQAAPCSNTFSASPTSACSGGCWCPRMTLGQPGWSPCLQGGVLVGRGAGASSTAPVPPHAGSQPALTPCHNSSAARLLQNPPFGLTAFARCVSTACFLLCRGLVRRIQALLNLCRSKYAANSVVTCSL